MADANEFSQPIDFMNGGPLEKTWGPYDTKEAACLAIENKVDDDGKNMRMGKLVGIGTDDKYVPHHWNGGYEDENLVEYFGDLATKEEIAQRLRTDDFKKVLAQNNILSEFLPHKYTIADPNGNILFEIGPDRVKYIGQVTQQIIDAITAQLAERLVTADFQKYLAEYYINSDLYPDKFVIPDPNGNVMFEVGKEGVKYIGQIKKSEFDALASNPLFLQILDLYPDRIIYCDPRGNILFETSAEGIKYVGQNSGSGTETTLPKGDYISDIIQIIVYGQSLSVAGSFTQPLDFYDAKTFKGGILTNYDANVAGAADTYFGSNFINMPGAGAETGKIISKILKELIRDENGIPIVIETDPVTGLKFDLSQQFTPVINAPGTGGASWSILSNPNEIYYKRLIESVRRAKDFSISSGKTFTVPFCVWMQGESAADEGNTIDQYYGKMETLFNNLDADIRSITGQAQKVSFIVYQIASFTKNPGATVDVPLSFLKIAQEKDNVFFGSSMYQEQYSDDLHLTSNASRVVFARMGAIIKRALVDGIKVQPITPKSWAVSKNEAGTEWLINMKMYVPVEPLVFDAERKSYDEPTLNSGFSILKDGSEIITKVSISRGNTINIRCSADPAGLELTYAITGVMAGGHLRDSQGDTIKVSTHGITQRVDNWAPIFKQII